jgi:hypothetical protein
MSKRREKNVDTKGVREKTTVLEDCVTERTRWRWFCGDDENGSVEGLKVLFLLLERWLIMVLDS